MPSLGRVDNNSTYYSESIRLLKFLKYFEPIEMKGIYQPIPY